jgi:hypothetical protein
MTSLMTSQKQHDNDAGYFIPVASLAGYIFARTEPSPAGANTGVNGGTFSTAQWAYVGAANVAALSSITRAGGCLLKDLGRTVVSSTRTFRKIQLVVNSATTLSSFGVAGPAGTTPNSDYFTGYIELGFEGTGAYAPVARFGR